MINISGLGYVGSGDGLVRALIDANRRRELEVIKKRWALLHGFLLSTAAMRMRWSYSRVDVGVDVGRT